MTARAAKGEKGLLKFLFLLSAIFYVQHQNIPLGIGEPVKIVCGPYAGLSGKVNYVWQDGTVDVVRWFGFKHYFIEDWRCLSRKSR